MWYGWHITYIPLILTRSIGIEMLEKYPKTNLFVIHEGLWSWAKYQASLQGYSSVSKYVFKLIKAEKDAIIGEVYEVKDEEGCGEEIQAHRKRKNKEEEGLQEPYSIQEKRQENTASEKGGFRRRR